MTQVIEAVNDYRIEHGMLIELSLQVDADTYQTYYISNCYKNIDYNGHTYTALAGFLNVSEIQQDISATKNEISVTLSAIPPEYMTAVLGAQIKGGAIKIFRVFFDYDTQEIATIGGDLQVFQRFNGYITNYSATEDVNATSTGGEVSHTLTVMASSISGIIENRITGRRTNRKSYQYRYGDRLVTIGTGTITVGAQVLSSNVVNDTSFNRIETLHNASFDFGKPVK